LVELVHADHATEGTSHDEAHFKASQEQCGGVSSGSEHSIHFSLHARGLNLQLLNDKITLQTLQGFDLLEVFGLHVLRLSVELV